MRIIGVVGAACCAIAMSACGGGSTPASTVTATVTATVTTDPSPSPSSPSASSPAPTSTPGEVVLADEGVFDVPSEIAPGTYTASGGQSCYWARLSDLSGEPDGVIANAFAPGPAIVTIDEDDVAFETRGCGEWFSGTPTLSPDPTMIGEGTWAVSVDVEPGTYRARASENCYWARLSGFSGELSDIIANDYTSGRARVRIAPGDVGFTTSGCSMWERVD